MPKYRLSNTLPSNIKSKIKKGYIGLMLTKSDGGISWSTMKPKQEEMAKIEGYSPFTFIDPNEINEKLGHPPYYAIVKSIEEIEDWIKERFNVEKITRLGRTDIVFEGDYSGTRNIL